MADNIGNKAAHDYHLDVPAAQGDFYVKGAAHCDWGMKTRLARMFNPKSGNIVMLAFDHGYIMGPTAGLERIDLVIPPLIPYVNVLMGTRGIFRSCVSPAAQVGRCLRVTYDSTVLYDDMSNGGGFASDMENALRMNADCVAVQTFPLFVSKFHPLPVIISGLVLIAEFNPERLLRRALRLRNMRLKFDRIDSRPCHRVNERMGLSQTTVMVLGYFRNDIYAVLCNSFCKPFPDFHFQPSTNPFIL